ncbi:hypothetical protein A3I28_01935 [Candidatus Giovannonibacteria bacterium RIFCSPLOWO2_02_FULL_43_37]|nr:MAG: hypothetical protein A3I28_01935 [Candidatus Giovannonibacteria bacterium RIFCSPLOWO2_02_FULL_43_37]
MRKENKKFIITIFSIVLFCLMFNFIAAPLALAAAACQKTDGTIVKTYSMSCDASECSKLEGICKPINVSESGIKTADQEVLLNKAGGAFGIGKGLLWGLNIILTAAVLAMGKFVALAGSFFDVAIHNAALSGFNNLIAVQKGWEVSRNIANLFFILILLAIAIATILRIQSYNAKQLLPKLIVIALLINFSLTISYVVIDFANILGGGFWFALTKNGSQSISQSLMAGARYQEIFDTNDVIKTSGWEKWLWGTIGTVLGASIAGAGCLTGFFCPGAIALGGLMIGGTFAGYASWATLSSSANLQSAIDYFYLIMLPLIVSLPLVFVFVFGGILMIIRFAILTLLLVLAPLAFLFYILPTTEKYWHTWWEKLISHAFFFPAFMFLLYISISIANTMTRSAISGNITQNFPFLVDTTTVVVLLISSLLIARTMGIYFASSVLGWATSSRKWLTGFVGGVAARNLVAPIGARLQQTKAMGRITEASPTLGYYARMGTGWLAGLGKAPAQAENMAKAALAQGKGTWGASFGKLGRAGQEAMLKGMTQEQRAEFVAGLSRNQAIRANDILRSPQFSAAEAAKFDLESWKRQTRPQQQARMAGWLGINPKTGLPNNQEAAAEALRSMSPEDQATLVDSLALVDPALAKQATDFIESRFSPKDQQSFKIARLLRKTDDEQHTKFATELNNDDKEAFLRKKDAKGQARFMDSFATMPAGFNAKDWTDAETAAKTTIQTRFSASEQRAFKEAVIENTSGKAVDKIKVAAATMSDEELDILQKVGDENKISRLINDFGGSAKAGEKAIAQKIGKSIVKRGQENKYIDRVAPRQFIDTIMGAADTRSHQEKLKEYFTKVDAKALRRNLSPDIIKQREFVEDVLAAGTIEDISLITGDTRRAAAFKEGYEAILTASRVTIGPRTEDRAQALANEMQRKGNNIAAQELRDYVAGISPYKEVITSILEGRAQPKTP